MAKEILTDDGQLEEVGMDEAKDDNKKLGLPAIDDEEGREDSEPDGEDGTKKTGDPKTKKSNASAKAENKKAKKEEDDEDYEDDEEDDEEEVESKSKKESKKSKKEGMPPWESSCRPRRNFNCACRLRSAPSKISPAIRTASTFSSKANFTIL